MLGYNRQQIHWKLSFSWCFIFFIQHLTNLLKKSRIKKRFCYSFITRRFWEIGLFIETSFTLCIIVLLFSTLVQFRVEISSACSGADVVVIGISFKSTGLQDLFTFWYCLSTLLTFSSRLVNFTFSGQYIEVVIPVNW